MELEVAVGYLLALAVPAWLVGEYVVHNWKPSATLRHRPTQEEAVGSE